MLIATSSLAAGAAPPADGAPTRKLPSKVTFHKAPSEESPAAREKRLKRECKGRPNAGACLGFASP
ncbi:MAG: hypothetical protein KF871_03890 [Hydrogenophaga sp.]|nr:hypothetical protein [Hydrogenophaga sp.]